MKKHLLVLSIAVQLSLCSSAIAVNQDHSEVKRFSKIRDECKALVAIGRIREAKSRLTDEYITKNQRPATLFMMACLSYELGDIADVYRYWNLTAEKFQPRFATPGMSAQREVERLVFASLGENELISYRAFKREFPDISLREILINQAKYAIGEFHFRRARFLITELERCQTPESIVKMVKGMLDKQLAVQERLIEEHRNGGSSVSLVQLKSPTQS
jgi:hypothetical protein